MSFLKKKQVQKHFKKINLKLKKFKNFQKYN
jgi:hypothetical protein